MKVNNTTHIYTKVVSDGDINYLRFDDSNGGTPSTLRIGDNGTTNAKTSRDLNFYVSLYFHKHRLVKVDVYSYFVGNPFMSHITISEFIKANDNIVSEMRLYDGNTVNTTLCLLTADC